MTFSRYSGAIGKPIALAPSSTQRAMSGLSSATFPPLSEEWRSRKEYANERPMTIDLGVHNLGAAYQAGQLTVRQVIDEVLKRIAAAGDDKVWISRVPDATLRAQADELDRKGREYLPL